MSIIDRLSEFSGLLQNLVWLAGLVIAAVIAVAAVFSVRRRVNRFTEHQIEVLKREEKYIPELFTELGDTKEAIRYFCFDDRRWFGRSWKKRLIKEFNRIYDNYYGDILKEAVKADADSAVRFSLNGRAPMEQIRSTIIANLSLHERFRHRQVPEFSDDFGQSQYIFELCASPYLTRLGCLKDYSEAFGRQYMILTGNAGTGKTVMLCNVAEMLVANRYACIFLNGRDIKDGLFSAVFDALQVPDNLRKQKALYLWLVNQALFLFGHRLFIIIDAVNENNYTDFPARLADELNILFKYSRIKVLLSCRREYFDRKFRPFLVDRVSREAALLDVKEASYDEPSLEQLLLAYRKHFFFSGYLSDYAVSLLTQQLLLLRIFFEVYRGRSDTVVNLNRYRIFKEYIGKIREKIRGKLPGANVDGLLDRIAAGMIRQGVYSEVPLDELHLSEDDRTLMGAIIDQSILISHTITVDSGTILEGTTERVYFVFDEIRDYCLARNILKACHSGEAKEDDKGMYRNTNLFLLSEKLHSLADAKAPCLEGVLANTYTFVKTSEGIGDEAKEAFCLNLLKEYSAAVSDSLSLREGWNRNNGFFDFGIRMIIGSGLRLSDFELDYIYEALSGKREYGQTGQLFRLFVQSAHDGGQYSLKDFLGILDRCRNREELSDIIGGIFDGWYNEQGINPKDGISIYEELLKNNADEARRFREILMIFYSQKKFADYRMNEPVRYFFSMDDAREVWKGLSVRFRLNEPE